MALKSTIYKAHLQIADMDRGLYADHALTLALHPSETEERLMVRLLAFVLQVPADDHDGALQFARGLSDADEPDLWQHALDGRLRHGELVDTALDMEPDARLFVLGAHYHAAGHAKIHLDHHVERVIRSVKPGQQVVKIVYDGLVELLGGAEAETGLRVDNPPAVVMMAVAALMMAVWWTVVR